jgi:hypothetical protein
MTDIPKSCRTCARRDWDRCNLSGYYCEVERKFPQVCGKDYKGWVQRLGWFRRIKFFFLGE